MKAPGQVSGEPPTHGSAAPMVHEPVYDQFIGYVLRFGPRQLRPPISPIHDPLTVLGGVPVRLLKGIVGRALTSIDQGELDDTTPLAVRSALGARESA